DRNRGRKQGQLRPVQRQRLPPFRDLPRYVHERDQDQQKEEDVSRDAAEASRNGEGKQACRLFVIERVSDERIVERGGEKNLVKPRVDRIEVAVLLLVHHHETVMLFENVIVAPKLGRELEPVTQVEQDQNRSDGKEEREARPQPASAPLAFLGVEVSARDRGKAVSLVKDNRPDG